MIITSPDKSQVDELKLLAGSCDIALLQRPMPAHSEGAFLELTFDIGIRDESQYYAQLSCASMVGRPRL